MRPNGYVCSIAACAAMFVAAGVTSASPITFNGSDPTRSASVEFSVSGTTLNVVLTNTSANDVMNPSDVLTAVFFDISGPALSLGRGSAVLGAGSTVWFGPVGPGGVVGGEWAYANGLSGAPFSAQYGISSTGLNMFGPGDVFPGGNLEGPAEPDGLNYGLVSAGDNPATGNPPVTGALPLIHNQVVFELTGLPAGFDPSMAISNVTFQYGTMLSEPSIHTPAPGAATALILAIAGMPRRRRRS
jgi:hypothetical protein